MTGWISRCRSKEFLPVNLHPFSWERFIRAGERIPRLLIRATQSLQDNGIPYAVAGQCAAAIHIARVDEGAVRSARIVELLIRRCDLELAGKVLSGEASIVFYFEGERLARSLESHPLVSGAENDQSVRVLTLDALVRMLLSSFRLNDKVDLKDMIDVGLIDQSWLVRSAGELGTRLQQLLDDHTAVRHG